MSEPLFDNTYVNLPARFFARVRPASVPAPTLLAWNEELASDLDLDVLAANDEQLARIFSGNELPDGADPIAQAYAGHQFAQFVPQLGDGRAVLLGEVVTRDARRVDVQLKGSGQTPFSRGGDGKSWIGPVIREYLVSEAMHRLGVPTTRALAAVATGETVYREEPLPGGVFTRVASSHIRVGTFQYFAARGDGEAVRILADYAIDRHYPGAAGEERPYIAFFAAVVRAQAMLVAHWLDVGFIHGVMNTDNTSVAGETIDYGPCAFLDEYRADKVFSSIDRRGRYAYAGQPSIAQWNLARLAECLLLVDDDQDAYEAALAHYPALFEEAYLGRMRRKLGLTTEEADDGELLRDWLDHLQSEGLDYTLSFRLLADRAGRDDAPRFGEAELRWQQRLARQPEDGSAVRDLMNSVNPALIPRNHHVERAIASAVDGDLSVFQNMRRALRSPFEEQPGLEQFSEAPAPEERVTRTFCGT